jgi:RNA polymerase-associated protein RTF1
MHVCAPCDPPGRPQEDDDEEEEEDFADGGRGGAARTPMPLKKRMALGAGGASAAGDGDRSEEEEEEEEEEEDDGYGSDYMGDDEDRARLAAMGEREREEVLFQRSEKRQDAEERRRVVEEARRRERDKAAAAAAPAGRKGKAGPRTRAPTAKTTAKAAALDELKARTAQKQASRTEARAEAARRRAEEAERRRAEAGGSDSDASASARSDDEDDERRGRRRRGARGGEDDERGAEDEAEEDEEPAPFAVIMRCCLTRLQLEKWADKPFFDDTVAGCFVRVGTGPGAGGVAQYRMAEVVGVLNGAHRGAELHSYAFGPGGRRTAKWLLLRHGEQERAFKMAMVSNAPVGEHEWHSWASAAQRANRRPLTVSEVSTREAAIKAASEYRWASADVARALAEKRAANAAPRNVALEKELVSSRLEVALQAGDEEEVAQCRAALAECEAALASLPRGGAAMTNINKRNATANVAILDVAAREAASVASGRAAGTMAKGSDVDPFSRRPTRVTNYWQTKAKVEAGKEAGGGGGDAAAAGEGKEAPAEAAEVPPAVRGSAAVADGEPADAAATVGAAGAADGDGDGGDTVALRARDDDDTHALAAAHLAAWEPIDISRCAGARTLPLLRTWRGGLNAAEEAIRAGKTLISVADYYKRHAPQ